MRLALEPDFDVVGEAENGAKAVESCSRLSPSIVLMDVEMPVMDGIRATAAIREEGETAVVVFSFHDDQGTVDRALAAGATAFVRKQQPAEELIAALRLAAGQKERRV